MPPPAGHAKFVVGGADVPCHCTSFSVCPHGHRPRRTTTPHPTLPPILQIILGQIADILKGDLEQRRTFLATGGLKLTQTLDTGSAEVADLVESINSAYPPEVVEFVRPRFGASLAERA